jgi:hypothetical protein
MSETYRPYEIAAWRWWPTSWFPVIGTVYAPTARQAVLSFLERENLKRMARVAVQSPDGMIERWRDVDVELVREGFAMSVEVPLVWRNGQVVALKGACGKPEVTQGEEKREVSSGTE